MEQGLEIEIDSAGTGNWHIGQLPDPRSIKVGTKNGCEMTMRARQVRSSDFKEFDLIIAMDHANVRDLEAWPGSDPNKVRLATSFDPQAKLSEVPDPYYGEYRDFEQVYEMLDSACAGIVKAFSDQEKS